MCVCIKRTQHIVLYWTVQDNEQALCIKAQHSMHIKLATLTQLHSLKLKMELPVHVIDMYIMQLQFVVMVAYMCVCVCVGYLVCIEVSVFL